MMLSISESDIFSEWGMSVSMIWLTGADSKEERGTR